MNTLLKLAVIASHSIIFVALLAITVWAHNNKECLPPQEAATTEWFQYRKAILRSNPTHYFSFQDELLERGFLRNRIELFPTSFRQVREPVNIPTTKIVEGRWKWKQALELDRSTIRFPVNHLSESHFSVTAWILHHDLGTIKGANYQQAASIIALGDGVWNGWRIDVLYPNNRLTFQVAQGKNKPPIGVASNFSIPPNTWTHIGVTKEANSIAIYINGILAGRKSVQLPKITQLEKANLKAGYIGNGFSSSWFVLDELILWNRPLSPSDFVRLTAAESCSITRPEEWDEASCAMFSDSLRECRDHFESIANHNNEPSHLRHLATFRLAELDQKNGNPLLASERLKKLIHTPNVASSLRHFALHQYLLAVHSPSQTSGLRTTKSETELDYSVLAQAPRGFEIAEQEYQFSIPIVTPKFQDRPE